MDKRRIVNRRCCQCRFHEGEMSEQPPVVHQQSNGGRCGRRAPQRGRRAAWKGWAEREAERVNRAVKRLGGAEQEQ